jgi:hypothetical protein
VFLPHLNTVFTVRLSPVRAASVKLTGGDDLAPAAGQRGGGAGPCFSLLFHGSASPRLAQGTYLVRHPALGAFRLFLVPVGKKGGTYQAIINRAHP